MASLKFEGGKCHGATEVKAMMRHSDIAPESRKKAAKGNAHIDVAKSTLNKSLFGLTYEQQCAKYDSRIAKLDATTNKNKRKDRVTYQGVEVAVPDGLERKFYNKFFINVAKILIDEVGAENFIEGDIHYDEEHEYIDAQTKELTTSRVHCHYGLVPEYDGQLNAQKLYSRATMRRLNKKIDEMTQREFGCKFMTGEKTKSKQTVDELKNASARLMAEREKQMAEREKKQLQIDNQKLRQENSMFEKALIEKQKEADAIKKQLDAEIAEFQHYKTVEQQQIDADRQKSRQSQQEANNKLQMVTALYQKALWLHNKLLKYDDVYLQYAQEFGAQLGSIKQEIDSMSL